MVPSPLHTTIDPFRLHLSVLLSSFHLCWYYIFITHQQSWVLSAHRHPTPLRGIIHCPKGLSEFLQGDICDYHLHIHIQSRQ